eukprot:gene12592-13783_t
MGHGKALLLLLLIYSFRVLRSLRIWPHLVSSVQPSPPSIRLNTAVLPIPTPSKAFVEELKRIQKLTFVSSNPNKIREVEMLLGESFRWPLTTHKYDLLEPQSSPFQISQMKCREAAELTNGAVIVEDTSLCFNALNGLPGPYIKWFYESIGNQGLFDLLTAYPDKRAEAKCALSFTTGPSQEVFTFIGVMRGSVVRPTGPQGFGWDPIFQPEGYDRTLAQMSRVEKNKISHRCKAFDQFKAFVSEFTRSEPEKSKEKRRE